MKRANIPKVQRYTVKPNVLLLIMLPANDLEEEYEEDEEEESTPPACGPPGTPEVDFGT